MSYSNQKLRVVVPVHKCGKLLVKCVESISISLTQYPNSEIVIVDNGENLKLQELLENFDVIIKEASGKPSAAYARNSGAADFENGILIFIDSDVLIEKNCIEALIEPICEGQSQATTGNYSRNVEGLTYVQKFKQLYIHHVYSNMSRTIRNDFWTAICAVDSNTFHELHGFDSSFSGANGEDQEFGIRLSQQGKKVIVIPTAKGSHWHNYTLTGLFRNDLNKGLRALQNIYANNVPLSDNRHATKKARLSVAFAGIVGLILLLSIFFVELIFTVPILLIIWILLRASLYSLFFSSQGLWFTMKSIFLTFLLEYMRILSMLIFIFSKFKTKLKSRITHTKYISEYE